MQVHTGTISTPYEPKEVYELLLTTFIIDKSHFPLANAIAFYGQFQSLIEAISIG